MLWPHPPLVRSKSTVCPRQAVLAPGLNFVQLHRKLCESVEVLIMLRHWSSGPDTLFSAQLLPLATVQTCLPMAINRPHFVAISVIHTSSDIVFLGCPACSLWEEEVVHGGGGGGGGRQRKRRRRRRRKTRVKHAEELFPCHFIPPTSATLKYCSYLTSHQMNRACSV